MTLPVEGFLSSPWRIRPTVGGRTDSFAVHFECPSDPLSVNFQEISTHNQSGLKNDGSGMGLTKIVNAFQNVSVIGLAKECLLDLLRALGGLHAECTYEAENPAFKCERQDWVCAVWLCVALPLER
jgi:hypothetical protein